MRSSKKYVDGTLRKYHLTANKALGQNFLVSQNITDKIVENSGISKKSIVIEIGPGLGALTEACVKIAKQVIAIEIDKNMCNILQEEFKDALNLTIIHQDFLKMDLNQLFTFDICLSPITIISNLPYYITSQILTKIIYGNYPIQNLIVMMQKEVANKLIHPTLKEYGPLHIILEYKYKITTITHVSKNDYLPRPEIDSMVLRIERKKPKYQINDELKFFQIVKDLFKMRRKTIANHLTHYFSDKNEAILFLNRLNISADSRAEQLDLEKFIQIAKELGA